MFSFNTSNFFCVRTVLSPKKQANTFDMFRHTISQSVRGGHFTNIFFVVAFIVTINIVMSYIKVVKYVKQIFFQCRVDTEKYLSFRFY